MDMAPNLLWLIAYRLLYSSINLLLVLEKTVSFFWYVKDIVLQLAPNHAEASTMWKICFQSDSIISTYYNMLFIVDLADIAGNEGKFRNR